MDATWFLPIAVVALFAAIALVLLNRLAVAIVELTASLRRLRHLEESMIPLRVETRRARGGTNRLPRR